MAIEQLVGEVINKSYQGETYTIRRSDKPFLMRVSFEQMGSNLWLSNGDLISFEADVSAQDITTFVRYIRTISNRYFDELQEAFVQQKPVYGILYQKEEKHYKVNYKGYFTCYLPLTECLLNHDDSIKQVDKSPANLGFFIRAIRGQRVTLSRIAFDRDLLHEKEQEELSQLVVGESYVATFNRATAFGIFLKKEHSSGLMYFGELITFFGKLQLKINEDLKRLANESFKIGDEFFVTIRAISHKGYELVWDKTNPANQPHYDRLIARINGDPTYVSIKEALVHRAAISVLKKKKIIADEFAALSVEQPFLATVNMVLDYGILLTKEHTSGMLYRNDLRMSKYKLKPASKDVFFAAASQAFKRGDQLFVSIKQISKSGYKLTFDPTMEINKPHCDRLASLLIQEAEINRQKKSEERNALVEGESYLATVFAANETGILLTKQYSKGLLAITDIVDIDPANVPPLRPLFESLFKELLSIEEKLFVTVKKVNAERYTLCCDKDHEQNQHFWKKIAMNIRWNEKYRPIKQKMKAKQTEQEEPISPTYSIA